MKLTFCGGAGQVTGANYLLEFADSASSNGVTKILIDCGLNQGSNFCEQHNYEPFAYNPKEVVAVFVSHAHIDHTGRLPKLVRDGFSGTVYSTPPTRDFAEALLLDSQHLLEQDAVRVNRPIIYDVNDVLALMKLWQGVPYHQNIQIGPATITQFSAGHILGSATTVVKVEGKTIIFSGDLGNQPSPLIGPSECPTKADYCLIESAYGDRVHEDLPERHQRLEEIIIETIKAGGALMIPAFALERTQILLLEIKDMLEKHQIPQVPIFIDSPLAIKLTVIYNRYRDYFKPEVSEHFTTKGAIFNMPGLRMTPTSEDSKSINAVPNPKIIIAGSGMSHGGRILHHERRYLPDPKSTLLIFGYQAEGSLGRQLLDGVKMVRLFNEDIPVRAKIRAIGAYSAHADQNQLLAWIAPLAGSVKKVFVVQGEAGASSVLAAKIQAGLSVPAIVPITNQTVEL